MKTKEEKLKNREYMREYRRLHPEYKEKNKVWKKLNREKSNGYTRKWQKANPEIMKIKKAAWKKSVAGRMQRASAKAVQRAKLLGALWEIVSYNKLYKEKPTTCNLCGQIMPDDLLLDVDHIVPLGKGGAHIKANLQIVHMWCHRVKTQEELTGTKITWTVPQLAPAG